MMIMFSVLESSIAVASIASTSDCIHACALPITQGSSYYI